MAKQKDSGSFSIHVAVTDLNINTAARIVVEGQKHVVLSIKSIRYVSGDTVEIKGISKPIKPKGEQNK